MAAVPDFRTLPFDTSKVDASGLSAGRTVYRRLYGIENLLRVLIHSVLTAQIGPNWWTFAVDPDLQAKVQGVKANYAASLGRTPAGRHDLYYTFLPDLNTIIRPNSHLFVPVIPDIDQWMVRIERLRLPRNVVGHMNWPSATDRRLIQSMYADLRTVVGDVLQAGVAMRIP